MNVETRQHPLTTLSDEQLMRRVQNGELDHMRPLFDRYHVRIYNYCLRLSSDREVSKDLTQEVFYRAMKFRDTYRAKSFSTWLYSIARNLCYDHYKDRRRSEKQAQELRVLREREAEESPAAPGNVNQLNAALQQLPIADRELIVMHKYQGMKYREMATITHSTVGAVRTKTHRALHKLKDLYFKNNQAHEL